MEWVLQRNGKWAEVPPPDLENLAEELARRRELLMRAVASSRAIIDRARRRIRAQRAWQRTSQSKLTH